jgi:hypothetical protein
MPSWPAPHCIIAHPQPWRAVFNTRVDGPTPPAHPDLGFHSGVPWCIAPGGLQLARLHGPTPPQPDVRAGPGVPHGQHPHRGQLCHPGPLAGCLERLARPGLGRATRRLPPAPGAPPVRRPPSAPAAGGVLAHATAGRGWPDARARPAWYGAPRQHPTVPGQPPRAESPWRSRTPRPPPPSATAGLGSSRPQRSSPGPTLAWF